MRATRQRASLKRPLSATSGDGDENAVQQSPARAPSEAAQQREPLSERRDEPARPRDLPARSAAAACTRALMEDDSDDDSIVETPTDMRGDDVLSDDECDDDGELLDWSLDGLPVVAGWEVPQDENAMVHRTRTPGG